MTVRTVTVRRPRLVGVSGLICIGIGIFLIFFGSRIFDKILYNQLILSEGSYSFSIWNDSSVPAYTEFYLFNWTNPEDLRNGSTKPILTEMGPYVYRETRYKIIDGWHPNGTVTFRYKRTWHFEPERSVGSDSDMVTTINAIAASAQFALKDLDLFSKMLIDGTMQGTDDKPWKHATVRQILFDGYEDPLLNLASMIPPQMLGGTVSTSKFGYFHEKNGTEGSEGVFNMWTGSKGLHQYGEIAQWNHMTKTDKFKASCGDIKGSAGELFPPKTHKKDSISVFSADICRSVNFTYEGDGTLDGIPIFQYETGHELFAHPDSNPNNWCYCPSQDKSLCPPSGVLDLSGCKWGSAAYLSFPHFYKADQSYRDGVIGMTPDPKRHQTYIQLEQRLRLPLEAQVAFQINILVEEHEGFSLFEGVPKIYFPTMWFRQHITLDDRFATTIKLILIYLPMTISLVAYFVILMGFGLLVLVFSSFMWLSPQKKVTVNYIRVPV